MMTENMYFILFSFNQAVTKKFFSYFKAVTKKNKTSL